MLAVVVFFATRGGATPKDGDTTQPKEPVRDSANPPNKDSTDRTALLPRLITAPTLDLAPRGSSELQVKLDRQGYVGPIKLRVENLPAGVTCQREAVIPAGESLVKVEFQTDGSATEGSSRVELIARADARTVDRKTISLVVPKSIAGSKPGTETKPEPRDMKTADGKVTAWVDEHLKGDKQRIRNCLRTSKDGNITGITFPSDDRVVNDEFLELVGSLQSLTSLWVPGPGVTDKGVRHLKNLRTLRDCNLSGTNSTDEALDFLVGNKDLSYLNLSRTRITDKGVEKVKVFSQLQFLGLSDTLITDEALAHIASLKGLQGLNITDTGITDKGLQHLASLKGLQALVIENTAVTDKGIEHLEGLSQLRSLALGKTKVSKEALARLMRAAPKCAVSANGQLIAP
jgi:hypothetical protein